MQYYSDEGYNDAGIAIPDCNKREADFYAQHKDDPKPAGFNLAPCRLWGRRVLAMPLISGPNGQSMGGWHADEGVRLAAHRWCRDHFIYDVGGDNWLIDENYRLWLVDYAQ